MESAIVPQRGEIEKGRPGVGVLARFGIVRLAGRKVIVDPWFYVVATVAVLIVGIAKGGLGGGIGVVSVPLMPMTVSPAQAAAIMLPILLVMDALAIRVYWRRWDWSFLRVLIPASLVGTVLGFLTFRYFSADGLRALVGVASLVYAFQYFTRSTSVVRKRPRTGSGIFWVATSGFTSFSIHAGGPPLQAFLLAQRLDRTTFQATSALFFLVVNWSKVAPYAWLWQWSHDNLLTSLALLPLTPVGVTIGRRLHTAVNDDVFFRVVHAALFVIGVKLLDDASAAV